MTSACRVGAGAGLALVVALLAPPAHGGTIVLRAAQDQAFRTPDANIRCRYAPAGSGRRAAIRCDVVRTARGVRVAARFTPVGRARLFRPRDRVPARAGRVVRNGGTVVIGPFRCTASARMMVCMSVRSPYGFAVGRAQQSALSGPAGDVPRSVGAGGTGR